MKWLDFWAVLFNPVAVEKFLHTISSGFLLASMFVLGISAWYILRNREQYMAKRSILVALFSDCCPHYGCLYGRRFRQNSGTGAACKIRIHGGSCPTASPMPDLLHSEYLKTVTGRSVTRVMKEFAFRIEIPGPPFSADGGDRDAYVPGITDHVEGIRKKGILSATEKMERGQIARESSARIPGSQDVGQG